MKYIILDEAQGVEEGEFERLYRKFNPRPEQDPLGWTVEPIEGFYGKSVPEMAKPAEHAEILLLDMMLADMLHKQQQGDRKTQLDMLMGKWPGDGISLTSIKHPKASIWKRIKSWFIRPQFSKDAIEMIE